MHPEYIINSRGKRTKIVLSMKEYKELLELAQDVIDARLIEEVRNEPTVFWEEAKEKIERRKKRKSTVGPSAPVGTT